MSNQPKIGIPPFKGILKQARASGYTFNRALNDITDNIVTKCDNIDIETEYIHDSNKLYRLQFYDNYENGFEFIFPKEWDENVTLEIVRKNNTLIKFILDDDERSSLIDILVLTSEEYESIKDTSDIKLYKKINTTFKKVYLARQYIFDENNILFIRGKLKRII